MIYLKLPQPAIPTCVIDPRSIDSLQPGDLFANSKREGCSVIFDGGLDFRQTDQFIGKAALRHRDKGRGIIRYKGQLYRYVLRKEA